MRNSTRSFLAGAGSVLAIFPASDYSSHIPKESASVRINQSWQKTGDQLRAAMREYENSNEYKNYTKEKDASHA